MTDEVSKGKILIIEDEISVCRFLRHSFYAHNFDVVEAHTGKEGLQKAIETRPDLIVLDYGIPEMSGLEVLKRLREWSKTPVIFLTARDSESDKVEVLDAGADDYLTKPFSVPELLARIRVALRHVPAADEPIFTTGTVEMTLEIDRTAYVVKAGGNEVKLTATEYALLNLLSQHLGKVVSHRTILKVVWGPNAVDHTHYLRVYFGQIRKKLDAACSGVGDLIENESGVGYRLKIKAHQSP
jgi:two-component system KDP operon response regulator KdpE